MIKSLLLWLMTVIVRIATTTIARKKSSSRSVSTQTIRKMSKKTYFESFKRKKYRLNLKALPSKELVSKDAEGK